MTNYNSMTIEALEALNAELMQQRAALRDQQQIIAKVLDEKRSEAALAADLAAIEAKHGRKVQVLQPVAIASAEQVGK